MYIHLTFRETFNDNPKESNRESAFIHAIIAAGTVHSVTKNCSKGLYNLHSN